MAVKKLVGRCDRRFYPFVEICQDLPRPAGHGPVDDICEFLSLSMENEAIERPALGNTGEEISAAAGLPASYIEFAAMWAAEGRGNANSAGTVVMGMNDESAANDVPEGLAEAARVFARRDAKPTH